MLEKGRSENKLKRKHNKRNFQGQSIILDKSRTNFSG